MKTELTEFTAALTDSHDKILCCLNSSENQGHEGVQKSMTRDYYILITQIVRILIIRFIF